MPEEKKPEELTEEEQRKSFELERARKALESFKRDPYTGPSKRPEIHVDIFPDRRKKPDESEQE